MRIKKFKICLLIILIIVLIFQIKRQTVSDVTEEHVLENTPSFSRDELINLLQNDKLQTLTYRNEGQQEYLYFELNEMDSALLKYYLYQYGFTMSKKEAGVFVFEKEF